MAKQDSMFTMNQAEFDAKQLFTHWAGQAASLEAFSKKLLAEAGELFSRGKDDEACIVRRLAKFASEEAEQHRKTQKQYAT